MTREKVFDRLNEIFRDVFDDDDICVNDSTTSDDIEDWDSLEYINLIVAIQDCFHIKFDIEKITTVKNVGELADNILILVKKEERIQSDQK